LNPKSQQIIQSIKKLYCCLVSNKNLSEYCHLTVGAQGQVKWAKSSTYDVTHKKSTPSKQKIFFKCRLEDLIGCRQFAEGLVRNLCHMFEKKQSIFLSSSWFGGNINSWN